MSRDKRGANSNLAPSGEEDDRSRLRQRVRDLLQRSEPGTPSTNDSAMEHGLQCPVCKTTGLSQSVYYRLHHEGRCRRGTGMYKI